MKNTLASLILALYWSVSVSGQSPLNFPRAFSPTDLRSTGFAIINPSSTPASISFVLYSKNGSVIGSSTQTIPPRGQFSRLGSELFPGASDLGWVQVLSPVTGLQGFWLGGDFSTHADGAESAAASSDQLFPLVTDQTEINIANTSSATTVVTIHLYARSGAELARSAPMTIASRGVFQAQVPTLFPSLNSHVRGLS